MTWIFLKLRYVHPQQMYILCKLEHYENLPMHITENFCFSEEKMENFIGKMLIFFLFLPKT